MSITTVTTKGQIVIPARVRERLKIKKGTRLIIEERGQELVLKALTPEYIRSLSGILPTKGKAMKTLLLEKARDKARENKA